MLISISNFKAIKHIEKFSLEKINVLTGVNSGGKSSLIQLLLLLKQSVEFRSTDSPLKLNRPYVTLGKFDNILRKDSDTGSIAIGVELAGNEIPIRIRRLMLKNNSAKGLQGSNQISKLNLFVSFKKSTKKRIVVDEFEIKLEGDVINHWLKLQRNAHGKSYRVETNAQGVFLDHCESAASNLTQETSQVGFFSFFPDYFDFRDGEFIGSTVIDQTRIALSRIFGKISYIGPLREEPRDFYFQDDDQIEHIGNKGENAAYILAKHAKDQTEYLRYEVGSDGILHGQSVVGTLEDAVNHWMCDIFGLGKEIRVETSKGNSYLYTVSLLGRDGAKVPITHVGFGVSQIFPILVEGLRPSRANRLIILEQPEIHLHPRVQSLLFDFVASVPQNVSFLIETHSDHLITRLRRRIAESDTNNLRNKINLTFVEPTNGGVDYLKLNLNEVGSLECWPDGFFDQYDDDVRALVKAQMKKKKALRA